MKKYYVCIFILLLAFACREKYVPKIDLPANSFLVVEGYINSGTGPTTITVSRTTKLSDTSMIVYETRAVVRVEGKTNTTPVPLTETGRGVYTVPQLTLNPNDQYRIYIRTANGKEYVSEYSSVRSTPPIDSISWVRGPNGVQIYANTHDPSGNTRYYQFLYDETWEFHMPYKSRLRVYTNGNTHHIGYRDSVTFEPDTTIFKCWQSNILKSIQVVSTDQLTQDIVYLKPLTFIENGSWKLSQRYTMFVRQRALSKEAYNFLEQMRKNTEQLGSIFDAQPSDNNGNIRCITNADEPVIGFIEVTQEREQRLWISLAQVPGWRWSRYCEQEIIIPNVSEELWPVVSRLYLLTNVNSTSLTTGRITSAYAATADCVDCTVLGTNVKPPFWP